MAIKVCTLGSGSKGNCVLIDNGKNRLLIDAGLTISSIKKNLAQISLELSDIDGILITHEHTDHVRALGKLSEHIPVYAHDETMDAIATRQDIFPKNQMNFNATEFSIGTLDIQAFRISHDAVHPLGFCISDFESKITYATDLGYCSKEFFRVAKGSDIVMIESNHDVDMLLNGSYPSYLKRRIISNKGHLSNLACAIAIDELATTGTKKFVLSHLSQQNNLPELAYWTNAEYLQQKGAIVGQDLKIYVAEQSHMGGIIESV